MERPALVAIIAAFNEEDIIGAAIRHLVGQGASVYLLDDGSTDRTVEVARAAAGGSLVGCESLAPDEARPPATYRWSMILERKAALAAAIDADWFIHQDADEFRESPWPHLTVAEALELVGRLGWNAVEFEVFNFAPGGRAYKSGDDPLTAFDRFSPAEQFDRVQVKCWRKADVPVDLVSTGGHEARYPGRRVFPIRFPMRHYPIRSAEHGERKVFGERKGRFNADELARGWHVQYDRFVEGHPVVPDAASLRLYQADAAMVALQVRNRLVEQVCPAVGPGFPEELTSTVRDIEDDIARQAEHLRQLTEAHEQRGREIENLKADLADRERRLDEHRRWLADALERAAALDAEVRAAHEETDLVNRNALDLARRLDEAFASRSWRLTRPLRAAWRLLGGK